MTKFNPENKKCLSEDEILSPAMKIATAQDANQYLNSYVAYIVSTRMDDLLEKIQVPKYAQNIVIYDKLRIKAEEIALMNIRYFARSYGPDAKERIGKLFKESTDLVTVEMPTQSHDSVNSY